jgi:hypothetical protein
VQPGAHPRLHAPDGVATHRALGCVGTIAAGAIRDLDEVIDAVGKGVEELLAAFDAADATFGEAARREFGRRGEW